MRRADARASLHGNDALDRHRHVDDDAIALLDAERLQPIREPADAVVKLLVRDLGDLAVVGLEHDRHLVRVAVLEVALEAVVGHVERAVLEPLVERRLRFIERPAERLVPQQRLPRESAPEGAVVGVGSGVQAIEIGALDVRLGDERRRRRKHPLLLHDGLDVGHACGLLLRPSSRGASGGRSVQGLFTLCLRMRTGGMGCQSRRLTKVRPGVLGRKATQSGAPGRPFPSGCSKMVLRFVAKARQAPGPPSLSRLAQSHFRAATHS
jgi:hypothetical protein